MSTVHSESAGTDSPPASGTLEAALAQARHLLQRQPELAIEQAQEILEAVPGHPIAQLLLGKAQRWAGRREEARATLEQLAASQPRAAAAQGEYGMALADVGELQAALDCLRKAVALDPQYVDAWRVIGDLSNFLGDTQGANEAYAAQIRASTKDPRLLKPAAALCANDLAAAETLLREHLRTYPTDVAAMRMLAEVAGRLTRYNDAEALLQRCLELAPGFHAARQNLVFVLNRRGRFPEALEHVDRLLAAEPNDPGFWNLRATVLARVGEHAESIRIYGDILGAQPRMPGVWMNYGHSLATAGRTEESVEAYRNCIELEPDCGEAYWSLANLKTFRFTPAEVARMEGRLKRTELTNDERFHFHFAIGKAEEDAGHFETSFGHYLEGNRLRRRDIQYDADANHEHVERSRALFTREFFESRRGAGHPSAEPLFVVGLPRAGSTLVEQILSSHSQVEGTMEHQDIMLMATRLGRRSRKAGGPDYPASLAALTPEQCRELGEQYLEHTRLQRKSGKPVFIDKMPNNFLHIGLIRLILPNARIVDVRRHPMACCFSGFKQHFARGQHFTYSLEEIGRYYRDYVELMAHFDAVLPGAVHRVIYEELVDDTEAAVRRLLAHCGLPFEESCLHFYRNERAVRTASAQQVRRPIFREGVDHWKNFDPWLGPLREALGPVVAAYPEPPP
jgi:predicted Zn-dependent protease